MSAAGLRMSEFQGQVCVVTGGSRGIGRAIVEMFAAEGALVHVLDLAARPGPEGGPERHGPKVVFHACDVTQLSAVEAAFDRICGQKGQQGSGVDVLVNNAAAVTRVALITELAPEEWQRALAVNVTGLFNVTRSALPLMGRGGRIVNLASTFGHVGAPGRVAYSTTKGAVLSFTRSLALDVAAQGVRVNSVSPGAVATDRLVEQFGSAEAAEDRLAPLHPIGRMGQPGDVADAVRHLASRRSAFMTGADMLVDGGYTAR